jgi:predicted RNase H-related nuclease YkuK (DUF458 family)
MTKNGHDSYLNGNSLKKGDMFISPSRGSLVVSDVLDDIAKFMDEDSTGFYSLVIGTDSQASQTGGLPEIDFVTAIVVYRQGRGARYYWRKTKVMKHPVLRDKIYTETLMSLDVAQKIVPEIRAKISPDKYDLEIHIDVGPVGPTREMIKEVVGMVNGSGFVAKTKPNSWGASSVADKHT